MSLAQLFFKKDKERTKMAAKRQPNKAKLEETEPKVTAQEQDVSDQLSALKNNDEDTSQLGFDVIASLTKERDVISAGSHGGPSTPPKRIVTDSEGNTVDPEVHALRAKVAKLEAASSAPIATQSAFQNQSKAASMSSTSERMFKIFPLESGKHSINRKIYGCKKGIPISVPESLALMLVNSDPAAAKLLS